MQELEHYNKPPLTIEQQIKLLESRGLVVEDKDVLSYYLRNVSYYHLSIYFKVCQRDDIFLPNTTFNDVLRVYTFDNKLRLLLLEILERIEKSFKARVAYELSIATGSSHCHTARDLFRDEFGFTEIQEVFRHEYMKSKEVSIDHYRSKYSSPELPPIWTTVEILSFGQAVKFTKSLTRKYQNIVARPLGNDAAYTLNWLHCLSALRNTCAHHSRLWNREQTFFVKTAHRDYREYFTSNKRLFNYLVVMQILLNQVNPTSSWLDKLILLIQEHEIPVADMGFPSDWEVRLRKVANLSKV